MGITLDRGRWYVAKRVPKRFAALDPRGIVRIALRTDSEREAREKAPTVEAGLQAYWAALEAGNSDEAAARYKATVALAEARGFTYRPAADLVAGDFAALVERVKAAIEATGSRPAAGPDADALLGLVPAPRPRWSEVLADFFELTRDRLKGKAPDQVARWGDPRKLTVDNMIAVWGEDKPIDRIDRADALAFRKWWADRVEAGHSANAANKQFGFASDIFRTVNDLRHYGLKNPFTGLRLKEVKGGKEKREPIPADFVRDVILAPGALDGLNAEARDILLAMVNTGAGPAEIIGLEGDDFQLDQEFPHIKIRPNDTRTLKTAHGLRARDIPAVGVSLDALRRLQAAGGCSRYRGKSSGWSATVVKYMRDNGLLQNARQVPYSLRHGFEDRLLDMECDERIRADLMGHKYTRPKYGAGGRLPRVTAEVARIAL
jgi:integrase